MTVQNKLISTLTWLFLSIMLTFSSQQIIADEKPFAEAHVVLQLSDSDEQSQAMVLSIANNLIKQYGGPDLIDIEIVAFGPGIKLLYSENHHAKDISSLLANDVRFVGCLNTIESITRKTGKKPDLINTFIPVQAGVAHIIERVQQGFVVIHP